MQFCQFAAVAAAMSLGVVGVQAQEIHIENADSGLSLRGGIGVLAIESREYVFQSTGSSEYMSLLIWQSLAPLLTTSFDVRLPNNWTFGGSANVAIAGDSYMEDYDWLVPQPGSPDMTNWSEQSKHPNTNLDWYFSGSAQLGYNVHVQPGTTINVNAGVEYTDVQWTAYDGTYIYSSNPGFRDLAGSFSGRGITYRQQLPNVFAGLNSTFELDQWTVNLGAKAGVTFAASATDHHWMRDTRFVENVYAAPVLGLSAGADYAISDGVDLFISGEVDRIFLGRSDVQMFDIPTGTPTGAEPDASGTELLSGIFKAGLKGSF